MTRTSTKVATRKAAKIVKSARREPVARGYSNRPPKGTKVGKTHPTYAAAMAADYKAELDATQRRLNELEASLAGIVPPTRSAAKAAVKGEAKTGVARQFVPTANKAEHDAAVAKHKRMAEEAAKPKTAKEAIQKVVNKAIKDGAKPIAAVERKPVKKPTTVEEVAIAKAAAPAKGGTRPASTKDVTLPEVTKHNPYGKTPETSGPFKTRTDAERHMEKMGWSDCKSFEDTREFYIKKRFDLKPAIAPAAVKTNGALNRPATLEGVTIAQVYKAMRETRVTYMLDDESPRVELDKALNDVGMTWQHFWDENFSFIYVYRVAGRTLVMAELQNVDGPNSDFTMAWDATATNYGDHSIERQVSRFDTEAAFAQRVIAFDVECRAENDL